MNSAGPVAFLKSLIPARRRPALRRILLRLRHFGWQRRCEVCGSRLRRFLAYGEPVETDFLCAVCGSKPPHRLAARYFDLHPEHFRPGGLLVHIAPEPSLGPRLAEAAHRHGMRYRAGGLGGQGEQHMDLLGLPFADGEIDLMYCCHVLNCLQDDRAAMREIRRVMSPDGIALLQVPAFCRGETTLETQSAPERLAAFGDDGIVRFYTESDYRSRLLAAGFDVEVYRADQLSAELVGELALKHELMHLCRPAHRH